MENKEPKSIFIKADKLKKYLNKVVWIKAYGEHEYKYYVKVMAVGPDDSIIHSPFISLMNPRITTTSWNGIGSFDKITQIKLAPKNNKLVKQLNKYPNK